MYTGESPVAEGKSARIDEIYCLRAESASATLQSAPTSCSASLNSNGVGTRTTDTHICKSEKLFDEGLVARVKSPVLLAAKRNARLARGHEQLYEQQANERGEEWRMWCAGGAREELHEELHVREVRQLDVRGGAAGLQLRLRQQRVVVEREVLRGTALGTAITE